jgi:ATP-dependent Clp protease ATP-binding subunit ClpA
MASPARTLLNPQRRGERAERLHDALRQRVVGQDAALEKIVDAFQMFLAGLNAPGRPVANFLFLGPTGTGKTRVVEALADVLFQNLNAVTKIDCGEFQHSHEIAKLLGSPPGYLGHRETHPVLTQEALNQYHTPELPLSLVLFDEIEKASDALWQLLLGILDKATLTLGDNRKVSFSQAMIFMTSNLGASEMQRLLQPGFGFAPITCGDIADKLSTVATEAARRKFSPEFFNRLDQVVVFHPLDRAQLEQVLDLELELVRQRLTKTAAGQTAFSFRCTERARDFLLAEGTDLKYGARHLKRAIERHVVHPMANLIATRQVVGQDSICIDVDSDGPGLVFTREHAASARAGRGAWSRGRDAA